MNLNQTINAVTATGQVDTYDITIPKAAKYVLQAGGTASILTGIWLGNPAPNPNGMLRVCGIARRGTRTLPAGVCTILVTGQTPGPYSILLRAWSFWDYFTINFYWSTC